MSFSLYENKGQNDVEMKKVLEIEAVQYLSNDDAMIIANWFYRKEGDRLRDTFSECYHYVQITGDDVLELIKALEKVLEENDKLLALHYFPVLYVIPSYTIGVEMWSDEYYACLRNILGSLKKVIPSNSVSNRERLFYYNIKW